MGDHLHRDDLPMEVAEELVRKAKEEFGEDVQVVFVGDLPAEELAVHEAQIKLLYQKMDESIVHGTCFDCGLAVPGWPGFDNLTDDYVLPESWAIYTSASNVERYYILCPECEHDH